MIISVRWFNFRKEVKKIYWDFNYIFYDLRSIYVIYRFNDFFNVGFNVSEFFDCLMFWMGYNDEVIIMKYVRYLK